MSIATKAPCTNRLGGRIDTPINRPIDHFSYMVSKANYIPSGCIPLAHCFSVSDNLQSKPNILPPHSLVSISHVALFFSSHDFAHFPSSRPTFTKHSPIPLHHNNISAHLQQSVALFSCCIYFDEPSFTHVSTFFYPGHDCFELWSYQHRYTSTLLTYLRYPSILILWTTYNNFATYSCIF